MPLKIRALDWRDLAALRRMSLQGICLHTEAALTRDTHPLTVGIAGYMIVGSSAATFVAREPGAQPAFAQLRSSGTYARVHFLAPASGQLPPQTGSALLEELAAEAGRRGAQNLIAEVDEHTAEFEMLRRSGFSIYARQEIYQLQPPVPPGPSSALRKRTAADGVAVLALYDNVVPRLVQQVEPAPPVKGNGYVFTRGGELQAFLQVGRGTRGCFVQPFLHPEVQDAISVVVGGFLQLEAHQPGNPLYWCVRSYQQWMRHALLDFGFTLYGQQAVMVKRLAVPVRRALLDRLAVLPAPEIKVTARIAEYARADWRQAQPDYAPRPRPPAEFAPGAGTLPAWERLN